MGKYGSCDCTSWEQHAFGIGVGTGITFLGAYGALELVKLAIYVARHLAWR